MAIVGAGVAGAACARALAQAGAELQVFDKSRGPGGRLATRRAEWVDDDGQPRVVSFDHGAPGFVSRDPALSDAVAAAWCDGALWRWSPRPAPARGRSGEAAAAPAALWVPGPDMPALCRRWIGALPLQAGTAVAGLQRGPGGWTLACAGGAPGAAGFDAVVLAIPPAQAAALLAPHRPDWAERARARPMLPTWTLMALTDAAGDVGPDGDDWDWAAPSAGPLARVVRNDLKPGRARRPGEAAWVAHATPDWSRDWLEATPQEVLPRMQHALAERLGRAPAWRHAVVHRWRYATLAPGPDGAPVDGDCLHDAALGLGVCGDAWGGGGVDAAWRSGRALAAALIEARPGSQARGRDPLPSLAPPR
ncbi:amine oxidase, flavin-containing [Piscinibacter sakaiensis]|uniref:Amine oxidase, flavin-containing n=1 Tax=Piscinibacter sakaiensis TaxID=1547922 RepID=A0A0K8P508_PISS1|nr:amine oxidase, flavin-containing [Piscinibacter sakaiensis]